jgi:hypothetical protein
MQFDAHALDFARTLHQAAVEIEILFRLEQKIWIAIIAQTTAAKK